MGTVPGCRSLVAFAVAAALVACPAPAADDQAVESLRRDLETMKRRLSEIEALTRQQQEMIRKQEAVIEKLGGGRAAPVTAQPAAPPAAAATTADEERLQKQVT